MRVDQGWAEEALIIVSDKDKQMEIFHILPALLHVAH
jgi:hypothetical protein